ncbi:MAG TPA: M14 family metallopeptidase [Prolixibacteraceae bacterium]|nr:M14 family metallopeptidase [Prolixibacteraceae bacterium]
MESILRAQAARGHVSLETLTITPGGNPLYLLKIGDPKPGRPAVFVAANMEGTQVQATQGALWLADYLINRMDSFPDINWYILPCGNPDARKRYFASPRWENSGNASPVNNDNDDRTNEDGPNDLNGDGLITQMLLKHPLGEYVKDTSDGRIVRKALPEKGEQGIYRLYTEGTDDDNDGQFNEDGPGGVNINRNFSYQYHSFVPENGKWNGSEQESLALMKFFSEHPEIAMTLVIGASDNLLFPPADDPKSGNAKPIKVPGYYAERLGIDGSKTYSPEELKQEIEANVDDKETGKRIYRMLLNSTPPTSIQPEDARLYREISESFKKMLTEKNIPADAEKLPDWSDGGFEQFAYFEYGLPVFCVHPWPLPKVSPKGKESKGNKDEKPTSETQRFLSYADSLGLEVFADWQKIDHPKLGAIEVGGIVPFSITAINDDSLNARFEQVLPFCAELSRKIPSLTADYTLSRESDEIIKLEVYITNRGQLPCPTFMGERNQKPSPVVFTIDGPVTFLSGKARTPAGSLGAGQSKKFLFLLKKEKDGELTLHLEAKNARVTQPTLKINLQ